MPQAFGGNTISSAAQIIDGVITTPKIATDAITKEKIAADQIEAAEIATGAVGEPEIADGAIINADINASAAISDSKLAQIATAGKVSGAALTALASIPAGAGVIPVANVPAATLDDYIFVTPQRVSGPEATLIADGTHYFPGATLPNSGGNRVYFAGKVPRGFTTVSAIKVIYKSNNTDGTVQFYALTSKINGSTTAAVVTDDVTTKITSSPPATAGQTKSEPLAADNYNALGTFGADDIIGVELNRDSVADTHTGTITVVGILIQFA